MFSSSEIENNRLIPVVSFANFPQIPLNNSIPSRRNCKCLDDGIDQSDRYVRKNQSFQCNGEVAWLVGCNALILTCSGNFRGVSDGYAGDLSNPPQYGTGAPFQCSMEDQPYLRQYNTFVQSSGTTNITYPSISSLNGIYL